MKTKLTLKSILSNILKCIVIFYSFYYGIGSICFAGYRLQNFDGRIPFNFRIWIVFSQCCGSYSNEELVHLISQLCTFGLSGLVFGLFIDQWVWDYSLTLFIIHIALSSLGRDPLIWKAQRLHTASLITAGFYVYINTHMMAIGVHIIMLEFPNNWSWWVCIGIGLVMMISFGEAVSFIRQFRAKKRLVQPEHIESNPPSGSFLYKGGKR